MKRFVCNQPCGITSVSHNLLLPRCWPTYSLCLASPPGFSFPEGVPVCPFLAPWANNHSLAVQGESSSECLAARGDRERQPYLLPRLGCHQIWRTTVMCWAHLGGRGQPPGHGGSYVRHLLCCTPDLAQISRDGHRRLVPISTLHHIRLAHWAE